MIPRVSCLEAGPLSLLVVMAVHEGHVVQGVNAVKWTIERLAVKFLIVELSLTEPLKKLSVARVKRGCLSFEV